MKRPTTLVWQKVELERPFTFETICNFISQLNGF